MRLRALLLGRLLTTLYVYGTARFVTPLPCPATVQRDSPSPWSYKRFLSWVAFGVCQFAYGGPLSSKRKPEPSHVMRWATPQPVRRYVIVRPRCFGYRCDGIIFRNGGNLRYWIYFPYKSHCQRAPSLVSQPSSVTGRVHRC